MIQPVDLSHEEAPRAGRHCMSPAPQVTPARATIAAAAWRGVPDALRGHDGRVQFCCNGSFMAKLNRYLAVMRSIVADVEASIGSDIGRLREQKTADDRAAWLELFGNEAFQHRQFAELALDVLDDVSDRFDTVSAGEMQLGVGGWPVRWTLTESDRSRFLSQVRWFSSNHHKQFGRLLTPLVDGMRVRGALCFLWGLIALLRQICFYLTTRALVIPRVPFHRFRLELHKGSSLLT